MAPRLKGGPCFVFLYKQIPARGALIALDLTHCAQVEAASSSQPAAFQKENTILTDGVSFFVIVHRFCCLHSRPPQGRGSVRGEPLTGSPTRVQSPARRRPLLRSKSVAPKKKDTPHGCLSFLERATRLDSLPASHEWQSHSQEPCRTS